MVDLWVRLQTNVGSNPALTITIESRREMRSLTEEQISYYLGLYSGYGPVKPVKRQQLEEIDLDTIPKVVEELNDVMGKKIKLKLDNGNIFIFDSFTPRSGTIYCKPSFGGSQLLIGMDTNGEILFTNGRWFV